MSGTKQALVVGATGGIGGAVATALLRHGWQVRGLSRDPTSARRSGPDGVTWVAGDAMHQPDLVRAAAGTSIVFHGANPPGYRDWAGLAVPMLRHAIAAARAADARLIFPGNLYVYGPEAGACPDEGAPWSPSTRKGRVRVAMEVMLHEAAARGLRTLTLRAGDVFGPHAPSSWMNAVLLREGRPLHRVVTPERPEADHAWAYLPDLGETVALLSEREASLPAEERLHFGGHVVRGRGMAAAVQSAAGGHPAIRTFPWWPVYLGAPFVRFHRELVEMRYLWNVSLGLDNKRLVSLLGTEPHTLLDEAVRTTLLALRAKHAAGRAHEAA